MGKASRDKGARYERELVRDARERGLRADRTAALQANASRDEGAPDITLHDYPELHIEAKRDERLSVDAMVRQADVDAAARGGRVPVVVYRRNRQPSRAVVRWDWLLDTLRELHHLRDAGASDITLHDDFLEFHIEARRDERLSVDAMVRRADADAKALGGRVPIVVYRRSRQPSRAVVRWDWLLDTLRELGHLRGLR